MTHDAIPAALIARLEGTNVDAGRAILKQAADLADAEKRVIGAIQ